MKIRNIYIYLLLSVALFSCEEYLDKSPEMGITAEVVYSEFYSFQGAVDRGNWLVMNYVADYTNWGSYIGVMGDEQQCSDLSGHVVANVNSGDWQDNNWRDFGMEFDKKNEVNNNKYGSGNLYGRPAGKSMNAIRAMGLCIDNIDQLTDFPAQIGYTPQEMRDGLLGQAYALRAWHQFEVIRRYGPILLVDTTGGKRGTFETSYNFDQVRPTFQRCADLIVADLDEAIELLPDAWSHTQDEGRMTKSSARGIKAMVLMYAASPLMNTEGGKYPLGQDSYDLEYAKRGIQAMVDAIKGVEDGGTRYKLYDKENYTDNWYSIGDAFSEEALFQPVSLNEGKAQAPILWSNFGHGWFLPVFDGGWGMLFNVPTQNIINKFETINGYPAVDFRSDDPTFDPKNPYVNRDPRLKVVAFCPGDTMYVVDPKKSTTSYTLDAWWNDLDPTSDDVGPGVHYTKCTSEGLFTGYMDGGKWRPKGVNQYDKMGSKGYYRHYPHVRYADMFLGLAELANEVYGPTASIPEATAAGISVTTAEQAVNVIRNRVGMPNVLADFTADKADFRERVRNEWAVEFYGEFRRWKDIRRWRIAKDVLADGIYGVEVTKYADGTFTYASKKMNDAQRVFEDKHYWYPIENKFVDMFTSFQQNPGW